MATSKGPLDSPQASPYYWNSLNLGRYPTSKIMPTIKCKPPMPCDIHMFRFMIIITSHFTMSRALGWRTFPKWWARLVVGPYFGKASTLRLCWGHPLGSSTIPTLGIHFLCTIFTLDLLELHGLLIPVLSYPSKLNHLAWIRVRKISQSTLGTMYDIHRWQQ
jgi:hypothetical protein